MVTDPAHIFGSDCKVCDQIQSVVRQSVGNFFRRFLFLDSYASVRLNLKHFGIRLFCRQKNYFSCRNPNNSHYYIFVCAQLVENIGKTRNLKIIFAPECFFYSFRDCPMPHLCPWPRKAMRLRQHTPARLWIVPYICPNCAAGLCRR